VLRLVRDRSLAARLRLSLRLRRLLTRHPFEERIDRIAPRRIRRRRDSRIGRGRARIRIRVVRVNPARAAVPFPDPSSARASAARWASSSSARPRRFATARSEPSAASSLPASGCAQRAWTDRYRTLWSPCRDPYIPRTRVGRDYACSASTSAARGTEK
jgi:hypothetical protein